MTANPPTYDIPTLRAQLLARLGPCAADYPRQVEQRFPHILAKLVELWDSGELESYLDRLVFCDRDGRRGFPEEVALELFHLGTALRTLGIIKPTTGTGWNGLAQAGSADVGSRG